MKPWRWLVALGALLARRRGSQEQQTQSEPIVEQGSPQRRAESIVLALLAVAILFALGFIVVYGAWNSFRIPNELLGLCLGMCLVCIGLAFTIVAKRLVVTEELEEDYPTAHPDQQSEVAEIIHEAGSRITRKRLLMGAGAATGGALGLAALTPVLSLGPSWDTGPLDVTPWRRGRRLVDEKNIPIRADDIEERNFYTAFPENADPEDIGSPLVVVRVNPAKLHLPKDRAGWAPQGILAFSKICTHAGCAVALYRKPTFSVLEPQEALVCPCHYSTFDPYTGGSVIYGPAGRGLPQLPLQIDDTGYLRAAGNFQQRIGPAWFNVRSRPSSE